MATPRKRIGELLVAAGVIDALDLQAALAHQRQWGGQLGATLIDRGFISESALVETLAEQLKLPIVRLEETAVDPRVLELVPARLCEQLRVFPFRFDRGADASQVLVIAMVDPTDVAAIDQVKYHAGRIVQPALAADQDIGNAIRRHYHGRSEPLASIPPATSPSIDPFSDLKSMAPRLPPSMVPPQLFRDNAPISVAVPLEDAVESGEFSFPAESTIAREPVGAVDAVDAVELGQMGDLGDIEIDVEGFDEDLALAEPEAPPAPAVVAPSGFREIDPVAEGWLTPAEPTGAAPAVQTEEEAAAEWESVAAPESMAGSLSAPEPASEWESVAPPSMAPSMAGAPAIDWGPLDEQVDLGGEWEEAAPMSIAAVPWTEETTAAPAVPKQDPTAAMQAADFSDMSPPQESLEWGDPFAISESEAALPTVRVALGSKATTWVEPPRQISTDLAAAAELTPEGTAQSALGDSDWSSFSPSETGAAALWATASVNEETPLPGDSAVVPGSQDWSVAGEPGAAAEWATSSTLASGPAPETVDAADEATTTFGSFEQPLAEQTASFIDNDEPATISGEPARATGMNEAPPVSEATTSFAELQARLPDIEGGEASAPVPSGQTDEPLIADHQEREAPVEPVEPPIAQLEAPLASEERVVAQVSQAMPFSPALTTERQGEAAVMPPPAREQPVVTGEPHLVTYALSDDEPTTDGTSATTSWAGPATDWAMGISPAQESIGPAAVWATAAPSPASVESGFLTGSAPSQATEALVAPQVSAVAKEAVSGELSVSDDLGALDEELPSDGDMAPAVETAPGPESVAPETAFEASVITGKVEVAPEPSPAEHPKAEAQPAHVASPGAFESGGVEATPGIPVAEIAAVEADSAAIESPPFDEPTVSESSPAAVETLEVAVPEVAVPEVAVPEMAVPEVAVPEVGVPEVGVPEMAASEVAAPALTDPKPPVGMTPAPEAVRADRSELTPPARVTFPPGKGPPLVEDVAEPLRGWRLIGIESPTPTDAVQVMGALVDLLVSRGAVTADEIGEMLKKLRETPQ